MVIRQQLLLILAGIILALISISCATNREAAQANETESKKAVIINFITTAYRQNLKHLEINGLNNFDFSNYLSQDYLQSLANLNEQYKLKRAVFSAKDLDVLSRVFTADTNFAILRPWSYQPVGQFLIKEMTPDNADLTKVKLQYVEDRWREQFTVYAVVTLKLEAGKFRVHDIHWNDLNINKSVREKIDKVTQSLKNSKNVTDFENSVEFY